MAEPVLEFRSVTKLFGAVRAVDGVSFSIQSGEIFTLLGPSGCGKTTRLRLVAGLEEPDDGELLLHSGNIPKPGVKYFDDTDWKWIVTGPHENREKVWKLLKAR